MIIAVAKRFGAIMRPRQLLLLPRDREQMPICMLGAPLPNSLFSFQIYT